MNTLHLKAVLAFATLATFFLVFPTSVRADYPSVKISDSFYVQKDIKIVTPKDPHIEILKAYLEANRSPMAGNAADFIDAAKKYDIDWKLVAAISGVESNFGLHTPGNEDFHNESYNAWGWGVYGDQALGFGSWKNGIYTVSRGLRENYINRGLTEPLSMNRVYASSPTWGVRVNIFMKQIEDFEKNYASSHSDLDKKIMEVKTSEDSAKPFRTGALSNAS